MARQTLGEARLVLRRQGRRTVLHDCYTQVPLRVLCPLYRDDAGTAYLYLLNPCGGVLAGDVYRVALTLEAGARAYLTTPAATQLYAMPGGEAQQWLDFDLHAGAVLTYLPQQTIPFAEAAFCQRLRLRLGPGAQAFLGEILAPGRLARGECFAYRLYDARLEASDAEGRLLLCERLRLQPQKQWLPGPGLLEGYPYLGTFCALGDGVPAALAETLHACLAGQPCLQGSATALARGGVAGRLLATSHEAAARALQSAWAAWWQTTLDPEAF